MSLVCSTQDSFPGPLRLAAAGRASSILARGGWTAAAATTTMSGSWVYGVILDAVATLSGTVGKQLLRHAAVTGNSCYYPLGLVFTAVIDPAFDLMAYSYAAQSIIAACAGLVVVWNVIIAPFTLGERLTRSRAVGAALVCSGTIALGVFGNHAETERTPEEYLALFTRPTSLGYYICYGIWGAFCLGAYARDPRGVGAFFLCAFGGSLAGNSFTTKAAVELTECGALDPGCPADPFSSPLLYVFGGFSLINAVLSLYLLAVSLRGFEALFMITVYQGFFVLAGAISGNLVLDEKSGQSSERLVLYAGSVVTVLSGLYVLTRGELDMIANMHDRMHDENAADSLM